MLVMDSGNHVERNSNIDKKIFYTTMKKEVSLSSLHPMEEKDMIKLFHIKIQVKETKVDALFNSSWQANLIVEDLVSKLGMEVHDHPHPYPLGWVNKNAKLRVTKQCKITFSTSANYIDEVEVDVVPLDVCGVVFDSPYMYMRDAIFMR